MKKSEQLAKLWPEYYTQYSEEVELLARCFMLLEDIEKRYSVECNPTVTRKQISEIQSILSEHKEITNQPLPDGGIDWDKLKAEFKKHLSSPEGLENQPDVFKWLSTRPEFQQGGKEDNMVKLINDYWRFDNNQQHLSTWHDKQDLIEKILQLK